MSRVRNPLLLVLVAACAVGRDAPHTVGQPLLFADDARSGGERDGETTESDGSGRAPRGRALIIGINAYPRVRLANGGVPPLRGAESDADAVAAMLIEELGFAKQNVVVLKGEQATKARVKAAFEEAARALAKDDLFVYHFSGHGTQVTDRRPFDEDDGLDEALCLFDTTHDGENLLIDDELAVWLDALPAAHVTVILDCCHAGTGTKDPDDDLAARFLPLSGVSEGTPQGVNAPLVSDPLRHAPWRELRGTTKEFDRQLIALFACRPDQQAYERRFPSQKPSSRSGQFTWALLAGLQENAADADSDGCVTAGELTTWVQHRLDADFNRFRSTAQERQDPTMDATEPEALVFPSQTQ